MKRARKTAEQLSDAATEQRHTLGMNSVHQPQSAAHNYFQESSLVEGP